MTSIETKPAADQNKLTELVTALNISTPHDDWENMSTDTEDDIEVILTKPPTPPEETIMKHWGLSNGESLGMNGKGIVEPIKPQNNGIHHERMGGMYVSPTERQQEERTQGFNLMGDEKDRQSRLYKTQYCRNMQKFKHCNRARCDFYHSVDERRIPMCAFGNGCKFATSKCKFCHPYENEEAWLNRTGIVYPHGVPQTSAPSMDDEFILKCGRELAPVLFQAAMMKGYTNIKLVIDGE
jgi:hypothetical protein